MPNKGEVRRLRLSDLAEISGGVALGRAVPEGVGVEIPYLRVANVQDGYIDTRDLKNVRILESEVERFGLRRGDVLLTEGGDLDKLGRGGVWDGHVDPCSYQNHIFRVRCDSAKMIPEYLSLFIASQEGRSYFLSIAKQTTNLATINSSQLKAMPVPVPSISEQWRIVEVLSVIDERIELEKSTLRKEEMLWEGVVEQLLGEHARKFETSRLVDVCVEGGTYGSNAAAVPRDNRKPRYVRITDIDDQGNLRSAVTSVVSISQEEAVPYILRDGDLLVARTGFTTGKTYLYQAADGLCAYAGYLVRYSFNLNVMIPRYAFMWMRSNAFKQWISRNVREVGQRNISAREYDGHLIPVPPLAEQQKLADSWEVMRSCALLRRQEIARLQTLKQALVEDLLRMDH